MTDDRRGLLRRRLTPTEMLVVLSILIVSLAFSTLFVPWPSSKDFRTMERGYRMQCAGNLEKLYSIATSFSKRRGIRTFALGPGAAPRAHESLNVLTNSGIEGLAPRDFICPAGESIEAELDESLQFHLDGDTLAYAWTAAPLEITATRAPLASYKYYEGYVDRDGVHSGHDGGVNVLYTDGSVRWVEAEELPAATGLLPGLTR